MRAADLEHSWGENVLCLAEPQPQVVCTYGSSLRKEVKPLQFEKTPLEEQSELQARLLVVLAIYSTGQIKRIVLCVRMAGRLELSMIKNLPGIGICTTVHKQGLPFMVNPEEPLASLLVLPASVWS